MKKNSIHVRDSGNTNTLETLLLLVKMRLGSKKLSNFMNMYILCPGCFTLKINYSDVQQMHKKSAYLNVLTLK